MTVYFSNVSAFFYCRGWQCPSVNLQPKFDLTPTMLVKTFYYLKRTLSATCCFGHQTPHIGADTSSTDNEQRFSIADQHPRPTIRLSDLLRQCCSIPNLSAVVPVSCRPFSAIIQPCFHGLEQGKAKAYLYFLSRGSAVSCMFKYMFLNLLGLRLALVAVEVTRFFVEVRSSTHIAF